MYQGYMEYLDTRPPDEAPPTTPIRKTKGQFSMVFRAFLISLASHYEIL